MGENFKNLADSELKSTSGGNRFRPAEVTRPSNKNIPGPTIITFRSISDAEELVNRDVLRLAENASGLNLMDNESIALAFGFYCNEAEEANRGFKMAIQNGHIVERLCGLV